MPKIKRSNSEPMSLHYMQKQITEDHVSTLVNVNTPSHVSSTTAEEVGGVGESPSIVPVNNVYKNI